MPDKHIPEAKIRAAWLDVSVSATVAAQRIGLSRGGLCKRAQAMGLPARPDGRRPKTNEALLRRLWLAGVPAKDIAALFGCHVLTISQTVRRIPDLPMRQPGGYRRGPSPAQVLAMMQRDKPSILTLAKTAALEQAAMINAEMADCTHNSRNKVGEKHARNAA